MWQGRMEVSGGENTGICMGGVGSDAMKYVRKVLLRYSTVVSLGGGDGV